MSEKNIDDFLREHKPVVSDDPTFLLETQRRLSAVEGIKDEVDRQRRYGRIALITALLVGLTVGILVAALVFLHPIDLKAVENSLFADALDFFEKWRYLLLLLIAGCAIALGLTLGRSQKVSG